MVRSRENFEDMFAKMVDAPHARAFLSGRSALFTVLKAMGAGPGKTVGICAYTNWSVVEPLLRLGVNIKYLDVDRNLCIDPDKLESLGPGDIDVLVLQHTFGFPGQLGRLLEAAKSLGVPVIEDCAHALGTGWNGRHVGSYGLGAIYSFKWGKILPIGQGGMLTVNDESLMGKVDGVIAGEGVEMPVWVDFKLMLQRGMFSFYERPRARSLIAWFYHRASGMGLVADNSGSTPARLRSAGCVALAGSLLSKAGISYLKRWAALMENRKRNAARIRACLSQNGIRPWYTAGDESTVVPWRYPFYVDDKQGILDTARRRGLDVGGWFGAIMSLQENGVDSIAGYKKGECRNAETAFQNIIHIPTGSTFEERHLEFLSEIKGRVLDNPQPCSKETMA